MAVGATMYVFNVELADSDRGVYESLEIRAAQHPSVRATGAEFRWGLRSAAELTQGHPRLHLDSTYRVLEGFGLPYTLFAPLILMLLGVSLYAVYALSATDAADT